MTRVLAEGRGRTKEPERRAPGWASQQQQVAGKEPKRVLLRNSTVLEPLRAWVAVRAQALHLPLSLAG